ncbi:daptide biosynthesis intramembrane metalloprotease [Microbacterium sp. LWH13-1.2]|uniref:daptide biosynthesis intramembrane metalloprotease n=1 Tax=Microbacterium sp. LWH13-1.2 TaxID=3135260 RepID=UPI00313A17D7
MRPNSLTHRRDSSTSVVLNADECPRLAPGVSFEQAADAGPWIAMLDGVPSSRVSEATIELLKAMDGETPIRDLRLRFAAAESSEGFLRLVQRFQAGGLLGGEAKPPPGRIVYRPPFTLQFATLRAPVIFDRLARLIVPLPLRASTLFVAVLVCSGILAAAHQAEELHEVLTTPVPLVGFISLLAVLSLLTALHESAHGITLTRFGGRPRRAGFMLFYLSPAFFVDVTDGWRLSDRRHRVAVALAGPAVHASVSAIALIVALMLPPSMLRRTVLLLAVSCAAIVLINLIPFVRFDGYIALMCALDEPNLRARAIRDGSAFLTRALFGGRRTSKSLERWWSVPFGLASLAAPVVLVVLALSRIARALAGGGPIVGVLVVMLEAAALLTGLVILSRALHRVLLSGVAVLRFVSVIAATAAATVITGIVITVPVTATFGFAAQNGTAVLLQAGEAVETEVPEGTEVVLMSNGLLANDPVGEGVVTSVPPEPRRVPLDALLPVVVDGASVAGVIVAGVEMASERASVPATGQARVRLGERNLWQAIWETGVALPLSSLQSGEARKE